MFKRNQVEQAIAGILDRSAKPSSETRTRLKRLLETDRSLGRSTRSVDPERANFAFFSENGPGRGVEIWFSNYEAFALLLGLRLMRHGWPQGFAVNVLRRVRPELEAQYAVILQQDVAVLFDDKLIAQRARPGDPMWGSSAPVFLAIQTRADRSGPISTKLCRGQDELMRFIRSEAGTTTTIFEITRSAHALSYALGKSTPRKRGRGGEQ